MDSQENPFEGMSKDDINNDGSIHYDGVRDVVEELTDPSMPTLPPLPGDNVDVDLEDGSDGDGDDYENDVNENSSSPYFSSTEPTTAAASMAATATLSTTTATTTATTTSKKAVTRSYKSTLQFRTDLTKSSRDVHPCGILHFTRIGGGGHGHGDGNSHGGVGAGSYPSSSSPSPSPSEEHAFAWISRYHDDACLSNALLHMSKFGFDPNDVVFIPYSSRRSWIDRYPLAFPHVFCGENGIVTGYPHWSDGAGWAGWEVVNLRRTSFAVTGGGDGVALTGANPSSSSSPSVETTTAIATSLSTSTTRGGARRKKKIFPTAHLSNDERDELHIEIYRYFKWLRDSLLQSSSLSSAVQQAAISSSDGGGGTAPTADGINDDCAGDQSKQSSSIVVGGGGGSTAGGIKLLSLDNLMEEMKSTFKVVRNYQINASSSSSTTPDGMPFLEEAIGEPLGRLAALARHDHPDRRNPSCDNNRRSGGLDFDDMYGRLERFKREHGHVNVPQKYAQDGQLGSWVANMRSKRKQMAKRGEEFEPDIAPGDEDNIDDENNDDGEDDDEALAVGEEDGGSGISDGGGEGASRKKRKRNGGRQRLTRDRVDRLDAIGFQWIVTNPNTKSWEERFEDLKEYQRMHGSTRVPRSSGTLGEWVHMQRRLYNKKDKNFLVTRAPMLDDIGFEWNPRKHTFVSFEDNFCRLVEFGRINGHYNILSPFPEGHLLGDMDDHDDEVAEMHRFAKWVKRLHAEYRSYASGKGSRMLNDARVMQLHEVGFQFVTSGANNVMSKVRRITWGELGIVNMLDMAAGYLDDKEVVARSGDLIVKVESLLDTFEPVSSRLIGDLGRASAAGARIINALAKAGILRDRSS